MNWKVVCLIASLVLTSGLAACSDSTSSSDPAVPGASPEAGKTQTTKTDAAATKKDDAKGGTDAAATKKDAAKTAKTDAAATKKDDTKAGTDAGAKGDATKTEKPDAGAKGDATKKEPATTKP